MFGFRIGSVTDSKTDLAALAALEEPTRRRIYDLVATHAEALSRDQVAETLELPRTTAAFHLERLADEGLLDVNHVRRSGRTGPGAGRPTKLYRRSSRQVTVSIPPRHYELAARLLLSAIEESTRTGAPASDALEKHAYQAGAELGRVSKGPSIEEALTRCGFEPRHDGGDIALGNCPFQPLAAEFTATVCGMNLHLLNGLLEGADDAEWSARLDPSPDLCCVRLQRAT